MMLPRPSVSVVVDLVVRPAEGEEDMGPSGLVGPK